MKVKVKKLNENAVIPFKTHKEDFCYDCVATSCEEIAPNVYKYGLGLAFEIERDVELISYGATYRSSNSVVSQDTKCINMKDSPLNLSLDFRPRSSVYKTGMVLANATGTLDEAYRGEAFAIFYHVMPNMMRYEVGDKIIQCKLGITLPIEFIEAKELSKTERDVDGFGSTGK
jgi:dUTP pyrophosphatase